MTQENVEIVRRGYEVFDRGELTLSGWDPECEIVPAMIGAGESRVYRGHAGLRRYYDDLSWTFSEVRVESREYIDLGDQVLVLYRLRVRGHDSGVVLDQPGAALYELRDHKIVHCRSYLSQAEGLEAVGLSK